MTKSDRYYAKPDWFDVSGKTVIPEQGLLWHRYDASDNRTGFTQRDGTLSTTAYDALNRPTSIKRPGLAETSYGLDIMGRVVAEKAGSATVRTHVYDSAGRKQSASIILPRPTTGVTGVAPTVVMSFTGACPGLDPGSGGNWAARVSMSPAAWSPG